MKQYSGIVIDGNAKAIGTLGQQEFAQEFALPENYARGTDQYVPDLSGAQILVEAPEDGTVNLNWELQRFDGLWETEAEGETGTKKVYAGRNWVNIEFEVGAQGKTNDKWRLLFSVDEGSVSFPYGSFSKGKLTRKNALGSYETVSFVNSSKVSLLFRILAEVGDEGIDYLGNSYRHAIVKRPLGNLALTSKESLQKSWMSKPNPSKFAVESIYFDVRDADLSPSVINNIYISAITSGVSMHVYWSNDERGPGETEEDWENILWEKIPRTFTLNERKSFALPAPIAAKYVKLEFSKLQARSYIPSDYQQKVKYKKHPKWVLDYFYSIYVGIKASNKVFSPYNTLRYNALDLYYKYFVDDILESPEYKKLINSGDDFDNPNFVNFLDVVTGEELSNLDPSTVYQIRTQMDLFTTHPMITPAFDSVLKSYAFPENINLYPIETPTTAVADTSFISAEDRESVMVDKEFPAMSFYLKCAHKYKESLSYFENNKAYFVGLQEVVFERDHYSSEYDHELYNETAGDNANIESNDLVSIDGNWTTQ